MPSRSHSFHAVAGLCRGPYRARTLAGWPALFVALAACAPPRDSDPQDFPTNGNSDSTTAHSTSTTGLPDASSDPSESHATSSTSDTSDDPGGDPTFDGKFDLADSPDLDDETATGPCEVEHTPCDADSTDPWHALGLNCPGELVVTGAFDGIPAAMLVSATSPGTATPATWPILEGTKLVILSTGEASNAFVSGKFEHGTSFVPDNEKRDLPAPLNPTAVAGDCLTNPALIGTGDCSRTLQAEWAEAGDKKGNDFAELRFTVKVPDHYNGFAFDFAFLSGEYPHYFSQKYNDFFVAWLESELWTGNISFDDKGQPISLNAGFLDYKDGGADGSAVDPACPSPCTAPELAGTGVQGHAATRWLTTSAAVKPGETVTLVFGVIDLADGILDAAVLLDNFRWTCEGEPPHTVPK